MLISRTWLSDYVDCADLTPDELGEMVTLKIAEVEGVQLVGRPLETAVVAAVTKTALLPQKKGLIVATVAVGSGEVEVVCGAPNCRTGMLTVYLPPGSTVCTAHGPATVGEKDFGGFVSKGILVSESELGVSSDHSGIVDLTASKLRPGERAAQCYGDVDAVIEVDNKALTHRPDLWSHYGFARELSAILHRPLKMRADDWADDTAQGRALLDRLGGAKSRYRVVIDAATQCRRFIALELSGLKIEPSPLWMRRRLFTVGAGVRNVIVDLSNYVMHDVGQPNHTYDADKLTGKTIFVRKAQDRESFPGLDGVTYQLSTDDVVVADEAGAVALGGVIGGGPSAVSDSTSRLVLECANFDPVLLRLTTKRHQLRTDASNRFEKNQSPYLPPLGIQRYVELLSRLQPTLALGGGIAESFPLKPAPVTVPVRYQYIRSRVGAELKDAEISTVFAALGFAVAGPDGAGQANIGVPYFRATRDISTEDDLVEEVGRIYGYDKVEEQAPLIATVTPQRSVLRESEHMLRDSLRAQGFCEVSNYSFMSSARAEALGYGGEQFVKVRNPIDSTLDVMRTTLIPGMVGCVERNSRYCSTMAVFELGRSYEAAPAPTHDNLRFREYHKDAPCFERRLLCLAYSSGRDEYELGMGLQPQLTQGADFYAVVGVLKRLLHLFSSRSIELAPCAAKAQAAAWDFTFARSWMHPFRHAVILVAGRPIGTVAEVKPAVAQDLRSRVVMAELDVELLLESREAARKFEQLSRFPDSFFEMSVVMPHSAAYCELEQILRQNCETGILKDIEVLSVYEGAPLQAGEKSVSVKLLFSAPDRTLSGEELSRVQNRLMEAVRRSPYTLRG